MSSLSKERNFIVTGSNAHRIMGGFESQLEEHVFIEFDQWQTAYMLINDRITDIRTLKKHIKDKHIGCLPLIKLNKNMFL